MAALTGRKSSIGTSAVQMTSTSLVPQYGVSIKAAAANTGKVYVGLSNAVTADSADATDGYELAAGNEVFLPAFALQSGSSNNINTIYLIGSASSQKVFFFAA